MLDVRMWTSTQWQPTKHRTSECQQVLIINNKDAQLVIQAVSISGCLPYFDIQAPTSHGHAMLECGPACSCGLQCPFRKSQQGLSVVVALKNSDKVQSHR